MDELIVTVVFVRALMDSSKSRVPFAILLATKLSTK